MLASAAAAAAEAALAAFLGRARVLDLDVGLGLAAELRCGGAKLGCVGWRTPAPWICRQRAWERHAWERRA